MLFNGKSLIGFDIGPGFIRGSEIGGTSRKPVLKKFGGVAMDRGAMRHGEIRDFAAMSDSLRELVGKCGFSRRNAALGIGGRFVSMKRLRLERKDGPFIRDYVGLEIEKHIPFDMDDVYFDFQILGGDDPDPHVMEVVVIAAEKGPVDAYSHLFKKAGLKLCVMDINLFALQNIHTLNCGDAPDASALADVDDDRVLINVVAAGKTVYAREISSFVSEGADSGEPNGLYAAVSEIKHALDFLYAESGCFVKKIVISGAGARKPEVHSALSDASGKSVEVFNPFKTIKPAKSACADSPADTFGSDAAVSMGLALRRRGDR